MPTMGNIGLTLKAIILNHKALNKEMVHQRTNKDSHLWVKAGHTDKGEKDKKEKDKDSNKVIREEKYNLNKTKTLSYTIQTLKNCNTRSLITVESD